MKSFYKIITIFIITLLASPVNAFDTIARSAMVIDQTTGTILMAKDADRRVPPASMSKLMTLFMLFEALRDERIAMDTEFLVSERATKIGGSTMFLREGERVSVRDLIQGIIVQSGNDACITVAENIAGTETAFADQMTKRAIELGMNNSSFGNSTGWPDPLQRMSARDLVTIANIIITEFPNYYPFFAQTSFTWDGVKQNNRNPLLPLGIGADGLKTGHTNESGYGLIGSVEKNNRRVSIVINGLNSKKKRTFESKRLFNIVFRETALLSLFNDNKSLAKANVWLGKQPQVNLVAEKAFKKIISPLELNKTKIKIQWQDPISAPIAKGDKVGNIFIDIPGKELIKQNIVSSQSIDTMSTFMKAKSILMYLLYGEFVVK